MIRYIKEEEIISTLKEEIEKKEWCYVFK
jgi:hypothetical protein